MAHPRLALRDAYLTIIDRCSQGPTPPCSLTGAPPCWRAASRRARSSSREHQATVSRYCTSCHDDIERTADLSLKSLPLGDGRRAPRRMGEGRPQAARRHDAARRRAAPGDRGALAARGWLESELDAAAAANPNPGRTEPFHRLNRAEYRNAVRDLLRPRRRGRRAAAGRRGELRLRQHRRAC